MVDWNNSGLFYLDDFCAQDSNIPEVGNMTMTRLRLNEGVGSEPVGPVLTIKGGESLHRAPHGAKLQEERNEDQ